MAARYYPVNLSVKNKRCLVLGGGKVAERKVKRLLESGARVSVVSPSVTPGLRRLREKNKIILKNREFRPKDLSGIFLAISAADDRKINSAVSSYCRKNDILVNVVDSPEECGFVLPSVVRRGALTISISTDGLSPALSKRIRQDIEKRYGAEYAGYLRMMKKVRPRVLETIKDPGARKIIFKKMLSRLRQK